MAAITATEKTGAIVPFVSASLRAESRKDHEELIALFAQRYSALRGFPSASRQMIAELQRRRLVRLVEYAVKSVPFYAERYRAAGYKRGDVKTFDDFARLPVIEKSELIAAWSEDRRKNRVLAKKQPAAFQVCSPRWDGRFFTVVHDRRAVMIETLMGLRQLERQSNGQCGDRDLFLEVGAQPWWFSSIGGLYRRAFISSLSDLEDLPGAIRCLRPAALAIEPSVLAAIVDRLGDLRDLDLELVIVRGERSTKEQRRAWSEALRVNVLDEYANDALGRIALECPERRHHLEEDAVYVELDASGELVGTSLLNQAMPLLRYRLGQRAKLAKDVKCACGSRFRAVELIGADAMDPFTLPHDKIITSSQRIDLLASLRQQLGIPLHGASIRMEQEAIDRVRVRLEPGPDFDAEMLPGVRAQVEKQLGPGVDVDVILA